VALLDRDSKRNSKKGNSMQQQKLKMTMATKQQEHPLMLMDFCHASDTYRRA
jgi:hypothetical protein